MNQNSNIRRIDELGRIVIPKDIRKKLHIKDNEPLEIFISNEEIHIKKYSVLPDIIDYIDYLIDTGNRITGNSYIVTDTDHIIAANDKGLTDKLISSELERMLFSSQECKNELLNLTITRDKMLKAYYNIYPLIIDNDKTGLIIEYNLEKPITDAFVIKLFKNIIEKNLNNY